MRNGDSIVPALSAWPMPGGVRAAPRPDPANRRGALAPDSGDGNDRSFAELGLHWELGEADLIKLHGVLFDVCEEKLRDPETPLDEVFDCLRWIFSERGKEHLAFSFTNTLKLHERPHPREIRGRIQEGLRAYLARRLARYPAWVAQAFWRDPDRFADTLERNPQWINERLRQQARERDLFAM
jgi:hypothetical protein